MDGYGEGGRGGNEEGGQSFFSGGLGGGVHTGSNSLKGNFVAYERACRRYFVILPAGKINKDACVHTTRSSCLPSW